jgi:hypothetical protein
MLFYKSDIVFQIAISSDNFYELIFNFTNSVQFIILL